ncbi:hypothetical protein SBDP1_270029 [Syntrophobacter sp. SbD1]|nr:hypothetical protein SBDP1_270029 [Syntrophobacter sp. SbD1]
MVRPDNNLSRSGSGQFFLQKNGKIAILQLALDDDHLGRDWELFAVILPPVTLNNFPV